MLHPYLLVGAGLAALLLAKPKANAVSSPVNLGPDVNLGILPAGSYTAPPVPVQVTQPNAQSKYVIYKGMRFYIPQPNVPVLTSYYSVTLPDGTRVLGQRPMVS